MIRELEALKNIVNEISNYKLHGIGDKNWLGIQDVLKDIDILKKALTPPTADEVCKALKDFFKKSKYHNYIDTVYYLEEGKYFYTEDENRSLVDLMFDNYYIHELPPHLITLIGRFYEGVIK